MKKVKDSEFEINSIDRKMSQLTQKEEKASQLLIEYDAKVFELQNNLMMKDYNLQKQSLRNNVLEKVLNNEIKESENMKAIVYQMMELGHNL